MKTYLSIYPHCYSYKHNNFLFLYEPQSHNYEIIHNALLPKNFDRNRIFQIDETEDTFDEIVDRCVKKNLGYIYNTESTVPPINKPYNIKFISSLSKLKSALGYNNGLSILNYVTTIKIETTNKSTKLNQKHLYEQIGYPEFNLSKKSCMPLLDTNYTFPNLQEIIISGDFDEKIIAQIAVKYPTCLITIRTFFQKNDLNRIRTILSTYSNVNLNFIINSIDGYFIIQKVPDLKDFPIIFTLLVSSLDGLTDICHENFNLEILPIIYDTEIQKDLISEMLLSAEDILSTNQTLDDIYKKEIINTNFFGTLAIKSNGDVMVINEHIGNIYHNDFLSEMTEWMNSDKNLWFQTRIKWDKCSECPFIALCPSITIYEEQGLLLKSCKNI